MMYYNAQIEIYDVINGGGDMFVCAADAVFVCQCGGLAAAIQLGLGEVSMSDPLPVVYVVSDSAGETAEAVVRAAASQFNHGRLVLRRVANVHELSVIEDTLLRAVEEGAVVAFTIVVSQLKEYLRTRAEQLGISTVDILSPMMCALETVIGQPPYAKPGLVHQLDAEYFRRIEAIEFAVKYDDGREARGLHQADVVLVGVSRTSKTPLSIYLAHKGLKVANVPLVPEVNPSAIVNLPAKEDLWIDHPPRQTGACSSGAAEDDGAWRRSQLCELRTNFR